MKKTISKLVCITGATSGIGYATTRLFSKKGYNLIITGRRKELLQEIKERHERKYGVQIRTLCFDIRSREATEKAFRSLNSAWKNIDTLINNAGLAKGFEPIHEGNIDDWETMIDTNMKGLLYVTRLISPGMVKRKSGHIINVCSSAGHETYPNGNVYCATKFAVDALTKSMRLDLCSHNVRVSQVSPAHVEETEFALVRFDGDRKKAMIYEDFNPLKSNDVAEIIYFIATRSKHINILDIYVQGTQQASNNYLDRSGRKFDV